MAENTKIEWCDHTFNPWIGCTKVSAGCSNCYAERQDGHRKWTPEGWGKGKPRRRTSEANWKKPLAWNRKAEEAGVRLQVFCASLADVFDPEVSDKWREDLFTLIADTPHLDWLLLTKRPEEIERFMDDACWPETGCPMFGVDGELFENIWLGVSVESQEQANERIPILLQAPARVRFLSCEPLLGPLSLWCINDGSWYDCEGADCYDCLKGTAFWSNDDHGIGGGPVIDWVIVGGESGPGARPMHPDWVRSLRGQCADAGVPFLFKQWGEWVPWEHFGGMQYASQIMGDSSTMRWENFDNDAHFCELDQPSSCGMWEVHAEKVGKKKAGNHLDGKQHLEFPKP